MKRDRLSAIRQILFSSGSASIEEIADAVGASPATVRRDLVALEARGAITRTRGGARIADSAGIEVAFQHRELQNLSAKRAIAEAAFEKLAPHCSLFLAAGTTVLQLARCIRLNPMPLSVFTNCLVTAQQLMDVASVKVTVLGGVLRPENASMVGSLAEELLDRLWFDHVFLGAGAVAGDLCIYSLDEAEARLNEKMLARATLKTLLVAHSKFDRILTYRVAPLAPEIEIITDDGLEASWRRRLTEIGCPPRIAAVPGGAGEGLE